MAGTTRWESLQLDTGTDYVIKPVIWIRIGFNAEPKVASAGEKPVFLCGVVLKEKRNQGRWLTQSGMAQRALSVSLRRR